VRIPRVTQYMRSHTGAVLSLGQGALMLVSIRKKINMKSSTEAELVGVNDAINFVKWIQLFVEQQIKSINEDSVLKKIGWETIIGVFRIDLCALF
jgi:hypothetical protein